MQSESKNQWINMLEERKTQKIDDSNNDDRAGTQECFMKKMF